MATPIDRYAINTDLQNLAAGHGITLPDDVLDELTHHVADVLEEHTPAPAG